MKRLLLTTALTCSACGAVYTPNPMHAGHIAIMADAAGMSAFMDGANGLVTNGKASPDKDTAHWIARKAEEREHTTRALRPSFLDRLMTPSTPEPTNE